MDRFEDIRPFDDSEVPAAIEMLGKEEYFRRAMTHVTPDIESFFEEFSKVKTTDDFQKKMLFPFLRKLVSMTSVSLDGSGFDKIDPSKSYIYISNHRDILLDATYLGMMLYEHGIDTPETALGDNLLVYPWMSNLVRINKSIIVYRNISKIRTFEEAHRLSCYINYALKIKGHSVWIAQREGRAKDSDDRTQTSVLKMLSFEGGESGLKNNVLSLNIVPVSISYEYDPCDYLKAREFQLKRDDENYKKSPKDDLSSMSIGLLGYKGNIRFNISGIINNKIEQLPDTLSKAEFFSSVAAIMDREIHGGYFLYPGNYVACDLLDGSNNFSEMYTPDDKTKFNDYIEGQLKKITDLPSPDYDFLRGKMYEMYANPLKNKIKAGL